MQLNHLWHQKRQKRFLAALFSGIIVLSCTTGFLQADDEATKSPVQRSIIKQLRYVDADKAKQYLLDLGIGTDINKLGTMNALIITTYNDRDRMKASSLISLIDSKLKYDLIKVKVDLVPEKIEDVSKISEKIDGIVIGTFLDPPVSNGKPMAIIDVHNSNIIAVVPKGFALPVVAVLEDMFSANTTTGDKHETVIPDVETPARDDFIATELMEILANAEQEAIGKIATEKKTVAKTPVRETPTPEKEKIVVETAPVNPTPVIKTKKATPAKIATTVKAAATNRRPVSITPPADAPVKSPAYTRDASTNIGFSTAQLEMSDAELDTVISLPTKVLVIDLLKLVGEQLGLNYMYDPLKIKATDSVTLYINDGKIKVRELYSLLESVLKFKRFVMTKRGNFVTIVPMAEIENIDPAIILPGSKLRTGDVVVTQTFNLEHIDTKTAEMMLKSMSLGISVQTIPEMGKMIITGYAFRMPRIRDVLSMVDLPGKQRKFQFRSLQYMIAKNLLPKIQLLAKQLGTVSINISTTAPAPPAPSKRLTAAQRVAAARAGTRASTAAKSTAIGASAAKAGVYLDIDERTNRIMMIGLPEGIEIVNGLIDSLDVPQAGLKYVHQYKIIHVKATYIIDILSELGVTVGGARPSNVLARTSKPGARSVPAPVRGTSNPNAPQISVLTESNSLLVNATPEQHERIVMVINYVDVPKQDARIIKEYEIENVGTSDILSTLAELEIISSVPGASSPTRRTSTRPVAGRPATSLAANSPGQTSATADPVSGEPMISVLGSSNSLLIKATPAQHAEIALIIAHVDRELTEIGLPYVIYALTSQTAADLKGILNEILNVKSLTTSKSSSATKSAVPSKITSTPAPSQGINEKDRIEIVADEATNSLIVYASKANQMWVGSLIEELDRYRPQVLLDVTLVEITKDDLFNLDLDIVSKYGGLRPGHSMEPKSPITALIDPFPLTKVFESRVTNGLGTAFYSDRHIQSLFTMMDKKGYGRVLARPSLLVKDNEQGQIKTEMTRYVAQERSSTTYTGTGSGNQNTSINVDFKAYQSGITLIITPHISSDKLLQLEIELDRKDFDKTSGDTVVLSSGGEVPKPYDEINSNLVTWAILPDGATIILGGIETINQSKTVQKVPLLGDIPFIGFLFRGVVQSDRQSKLYVFVKAHIISPSDELMGNSDIELISQKKRKAFEDSEKRFQSLQAMPGIKPNPMQPERILEDDEYLKKIRTKNLIGSITTVEVVLPK